MKKAIQATWVGILTVAVGSMTFASTVEAARSENKLQKMEANQEEKTAEPGNAGTVVNLPGTNSWTEDFVIHSLENISDYEFNNFKKLILSQAQAVNSNYTAAEVEEIKQALEAPDAKKGAFYIQSVLNPDITIMGFGFGGLFGKVLLSVGASLLGLIFDISAWTTGIGAVACLIDGSMQTDLTLCTQAVQYAKEKIVQFLNSQGVNLGQAPSS